MQCGCGGTVNPIASKNDGSGCSDGCPVNPSQKCGGSYFMNLYQINNPSRRPPPLNSKKTPMYQTSRSCANKICHAPLSQHKRIAALLSQMTFQVKADNTIKSAAGVQRLRLSAYARWGRGTRNIHGEQRQMLTV